jgi:hypothetical protein
LSRGLAVDGASIDPKSRIDSGEYALNSDRTRPAIFELAPHAIGLLLFGVFFATVFAAAEAGLPRSIYSDSSFTLSLVQQLPLARVLALTSAVFLLWLISPVGRGRLAWQRIDSVGGFR